MRTRRTRGTVGCSHSLRQQDSEATPVLSPPPGLRDFSAFVVRGRLRKLTAEPSGYCQYVSGKQAKLQRRQQKSNDAPSWSALDIRMLRDDVDWLYSLGQASQSDPNWEAVTGLALTPHMARVVHEGVALLRSLRPTQITAVELKFSAEIAAARHTVKLLDDTKKLYDGVIQDFERIDGKHSGIWPRGQDLAIGFREDRLFTTSRAAAFQRSGLVDDIRSTGRGSYSHRLGYDIGSAAATVLRQFGYGPQAVTLPVGQWGEAPRITAVNRLDYYSERFEPEFPWAVKDVLTVIEGSINSCLYLFRPAEGPFAGPVFRVLLVTLAHSLNAIDEIHKKYPELASRRGTSKVINVLESSEATSIRRLRGLRNRCMHYGIPSNLTELDEFLPMYGLVEATSPGLTYESVNRDMVLVLSALSDALAGWGK